MSHFLTDHCAVVMHKNYLRNTHAEELKGKEAPACNFRNVNVWMERQITYMCM